MAVGLLPALAATQQPRQRRASRNRTVHAAPAGPASHVRGRTRAHHHRHRPGRPTEKTTTLANTAIKTGQSGKLVFVTIRSEYRQGGTVCLVDEQDYIYRSGEPPSKGFTAPVFDPTRRPLTPWSELFVGDPVRLFRFSALTANPHRIHYDRPYAQEVEGYPDIVVHGPLLALLMSDLVREHSSGVIRSVEFRLRRPVFRGERMWVTGEPGASSVSTTVRSHAEDIRAEATFTVAE